MGKKYQHFFFNPEKRYYEKKAINKFQIGNTVKTNQKDILYELADHYEKLYTATKLTQKEQKELSKYIDQVKLPNITDDQKLLCDSPITDKECKAAIKELKN